MERVTSRQNALVKRFRELARASRVPAPAGTAEQDAGHLGEILLDGEHLVHEALAFDLPIEIAVFSDRLIAHALSPLTRIAEDVRQRGGRPVIVTDEVLAAISPVQHPSGVVAIARVRQADVGTVFASAGWRGEHADRAATVPLIVVLSGVQDPGNVGAIVRSGAAFEASGLVAIEGSANPFNWKALRGAMGATFRMPIARAGTLSDVITAARAHAIRLVAAVPRGGRPLPDVDLRHPCAIVFGGEGAGLSNSVIAAAHDVVTIPMRAPVESLNVAVAAALVLYDASRQRQPSARRGDGGRR